jgi:hypothetical protein
METILPLIVAIMVVALLLRRSAPQTQVVYVPLAVEEERGALGCLPLLLIAMLFLLVLALMQT